jgi:hypothetical protein
MLLYQVMSIKKNKKHIFFYLKENVLILDVELYIDDLAYHIVDFVYDWHLLKNDIVKCSDKLIKELISTKIKKDLDFYIKISQENNCRFVSFLNKTNKHKDWHKYFDDYNKFNKFSKNSCKKHLPNFFESKKDYSFFSKRKGNFLNFECVIPSGEDEEFLLKILDKIKPTTKYFWEL